MGEEGGLAIKKEIAAYARVQCTEFVEVPWSTVIRATRNLGMEMYNPAAVYGGEFWDEGY